MAARARIVALVLIGVGFAALPALAAAPAQLTALPLSAIEGTSFTAEVGTYSGACGSLAGASINWGDGGVQSATLAQVTGGACEILASHTYAEDGTYTTTVVVTPAAGGTTGSATSTATVADAPLKLTPATITGTADVATNGTVATLTDSGGLEPNSDYEVVIDWGDGHMSGGTVTATGNITGTNTYASPGTYAIEVTVTDKGGQSASVGTSASVSAGTPPACTKAPPTAAASFTPSAATPDGRWLQAVYDDILGSAIAPATLNELTASMLQGAGREVLVEYLEGDPDRPIIIGSEFNQYLGRLPSGSELTYWTQFLSSGQTDEALAAAVLGSAEYYGKHGSNTTGFAAGLYCDLLYRVPDNASLSYWETQLGSGATRQQVAGDLLASTERLQLLVDRLYLRFLRRQPSGAEQTYWVTQLQQGATDEQVIAALTSSQEYFNLFAGVGPVLTAAMINSRGVIHVALKQPTTLALRVLLLPAVKADAKLRVPAPKTRLVGTVPLGHHRAGHATIRWNLKVGKRKVKPGRYLLVLEARRGHKLVAVSDAIAVKLR